MNRVLLQDTATAMATATIWVHKLLWWNNFAAALRDELFFGCRAGESESHEEASPGKCTIAS